MTQCNLCDDGFPMKNGIHYGTQRLGMIPDTPCRNVPAPLTDEQVDAVEKAAYDPNRPLRNVYRSRVVKELLATVWRLRSEIRTLHERKDDHKRDFDTIERLRGENETVRRDTIETCAAVVDRYLAAYPSDIFIEPPTREHGHTVDACSARALRGVLPNIARDIRALATEEAV